MDDILSKSGSSRYSEFYERLLIPIEKYNKWDNTTTKNVSANVLKCYITNDKGIGCMVLEGRNNQTCLMFFYTGLVVYENINKLDTQSGINELKNDFIKKLTYSLTGEYYTKTFGWSFVFDKKGYPRIMTVINKQYHLYKMLPKIWYIGNSYPNWTQKI
jgi:hypothetical protein